MRQERNQRKRSFLTSEGEANSHPVAVSYFVAFLFEQALMESVSFALELWHGA